MFETFRRNQESMRLDANDHLLLGIRNPAYSIGLCRIIRCRVGEASVRFPSEGVKLPLHGDPPHANNRQSATLTSMLIYLNPHSLEGFIFIHAGKMLKTHDKSGCP